MEVDTARPEEKTIRELQVDMENVAVWSRKQVPSRFAGFRRLASCNGRKILQRNHCKQVTKFVSK